MSGKKIQTVTDRAGREVEVVTRRRKRPMFGGTESVIGERVQKDLDAKVLGDLFASLDISKPVEQPASPTGRKPS